jgi:hypothetical protein
VRSASVFNWCYFKIIHYSLTIHDFELFNRYYLRGYHFGCFISW